MSWATNHTVTIQIDGVDRTAAVQPQSIYVRQQIGNESSICGFVLWDNTGNVRPGGWDEVLVTVDGARIFGGFVTAVETYAVDNQSGTFYQVECKDWSVLLDIVAVNAAYGPYDNGSTIVSYSDGDIVADLFSTYLSGEGFDASTYVTDQASAVEIGYQNVTMRAALNALAVRVGADWYIDPNKNVRWFDPASPGAAAFEIDSESPNWSTSYPPLRNSVRRTVDVLNVVNYVEVVGGYREVRTTETLTYRAGAATYSLVNTPIKNVVQVSANTTGAGPLPATNASNRLGYAPEDSLVQDGGEAWYLVDLAAGTITLDAIVTAQCSAGDQITVDYVYLVQVTATATDTESIATYGRTLKRTYYNESLTSDTAAQEFANEILAENAYGRETLEFEVAEYGLLAGRLLTAYIPDTEVGDEELLQKESDGDTILLEDATGGIETESSGQTQTYLIQEVEYSPVMTADGYLLVARVTAGYYQSTLVEALARLTGGGASGMLPAVRYPGSLGAISGDLGEVVAGRMTLTDGGTAPFTWGDYAGHTGVVVGLDDSGTAVYGSFLLLDNGQARAKIGRLNGLSGPGTVVPTGWGIWTTNGYFQGTVAASLLSGGTIDGGLITASQIIGGTVATGTPPLNSSNPGVILTADGVRGYGSAGLTFALYSDGRPPLISSGTIQEMVFEAYTAGVFRTSANPSSSGGVQIDSSGIFAYDSGGTLKTSVDASTGRISATDGFFSGTVQAAGGTVVLDDSGVTFGPTAGTTDYIEPIATTWIDSSGSIVAWTQGRENTNLGVTHNEMMLAGGTASGNSGMVGLFGFDSAGGLPGHIMVAPDWIYLHTRYDSGTTSGTIHAASNVIGLNAEFITLAGKTTLSGGLTTFRSGANFDGGTIWTSANFANDLLPDGSGLYSLGNSTKAWRYLYLYDGADEWRVEINSSGSIVTTKV